MPGRRALMVVGIYLLALPVLAFAVVVWSIRIEPARHNRAAVGSLVEASFEGERRLVLFTGRGPWIARPPGRPWTDREQVPEHLIQALLFQEDQAFYKHRGYSPREIFIVLRDHLVYGHRLRGASTLSQQLARTMFLDQARSARRKLLEFRLAILLESRCSKARLLELYLNQVYWGADVRGIGPAARHYFRKAARDLRPEESAFLVALLPNPNACPPAAGSAIATCRNDGVLRRMKRLNQHLLE